MIRLVPMTETEFQAFRASDIAEYAQEHVKSGRWRPEESLHAAEQEFNDLLNKGLKIGKAFALTRGPIDLAIGDREPGKQMAGATTMRARFVQERLAWACPAVRLLALTGLNRRFLVQTDQPSACSQECLRLSIGLEHWAGPFLRR